MFLQTTPLVVMTTFCKARSTSVKPFYMISKSWWYFQNNTHLDECHNLIQPHQILTCMSSFSSSMILSMIVSTPFLSTWVVLRHFLSSSHVQTASTSRYQVKDSIHQITFCQFEGLSDNISLCTSITWSRRSSAKCWFSSNSFRTARKNETIL